MYPRWSTLYMLTLLAACSPAVTPMTDSQRTAIADTLKAKTQAVADGGSRADVTATFGTTSTSPEFLVADNGTLLTREQLLAAFTEAFARLERQDITLEEIHVAVLTPDIGVVSAKGKFTSTYKDGKVTPLTPFAWTFVWRREGGEWKWMNSHQSFGPSAK